jgi:predicted GNAT family N-acyltransferase
MAVRQKVFAIEQSLSIEELQDEQDEQAFHVVLLGQHAEPVACARLASVGFGRWLISHVAVVSAHRGSGAATLAMQVLQAHAQCLGLQSVLLHAQGHAVGLYTRQGFRAVGEPSVVRGTPHQPMVWTVPGNCQRR